MIKRILVALDPDPDSQNATRYAAELARYFDASVNGLAIVDTHHIAMDVGPGGAVGGLYYAEQVRKTLSTESRHAALQLIQTFGDQLTQQQVRHETHVEEGSATARIVEAARYHDLLVIGQASHFYYARPEKETNTLARIVKSTITPTLIVQEHFQPTRRVVVAYDGSPASARTLQRFVQFAPFGHDVVVDIVHVQSLEDRRHVQEAKLLVKMAAEYVRAHPFTRVEETCRAASAPAPLLLEHARETGATLIVAGAHAVSAARRVAFGSTTHALLAGANVSLFVYH